MFSFQGKACSIAVLWIFLMTAAPMADPLTLATGEWVPYSSKNMVDYGTFTRWVSIVFKEMDVEPAYRFYPWQRCYDVTLKGIVWATFPYSYTKERAEKFWFSQTLACSKTLFFYYDHGHSKKTYSIKHEDDLKSYKIGGVRGYYYEEFFKKAGIKIDYVNKEINALEKLRLGRIDVMPFNELVGWTLIEAHFPSERHKFKTLATPLSVDKLCLMVSRDYPGSKELLQRFNRALSTCARKGLITVDSCELNVGLMK